jgi:hypothetical protein
VANKKEELLWSVALPGFGQFLNGKLIKGTVFVFLEFLINVQGSFNEALISSFLGDIEKAISQVDYQLLMFYPCLYFFAMWDAFKDADGGKEKYDFLPFVFSAYFVTVGCIYSSKLTIIGVLFGPVWLPMLFVIPGIVVGLFIRMVCLN